MAGLLGFSDDRPVNIANILTVIGLLGLAFSTMPYGLVILAALVWLWRRG